MRVPPNGDDHLWHPIWKLTLMLIYKPTNALGGGERGTSHPPPNPCTPLNAFVALYRKPHSNACDAFNFPI